MKIKTTIAALGLFSVVSFGASAAQLVNSQQAENLQSAGDNYVEWRGGYTVGYSSAAVTESRS